MVIIHRPSIFFHLSSCMAGFCWRKPEFRQRIYAVKARKWPTCCLMTDCAVHLQHWKCQFSKVRYFNSFSSLVQGINLQPFLALRRTNVFFSFQIFITQNIAQQKTVGAKHLGSFPYSCWKRLSLKTKQNEKKKTVNLPVAPL